MTMKRTSIVLVFIALLALAACAPAQQQPSPQPAPTENAPAPTPITPSTPASDYSLSQETRDKAMAGLTVNAKYALSENYVKLYAGQSHTFGIAFMNSFSKNDNFLVDIQFKKAYDKSSNSIDVTEAQIAPWLAHNDFTVTPLEAYQKSVQPIVIEAAVFADGTPPPKGTYVFEAQVFHQGTAFKVDEEYSGEQQISIQVI
jgi:hypothetical protein